MHAHSSLTLMTTWAVAHQAPLSMGFSRQAYWSGLPFPCSGDLPNPGIKPASPTLLVDSLPHEPSGRFHWTAKWLSYIYIFFHILFHYDLSQDIEYSSLCSTIGPCFASILYLIYNNLHLLTPNGGEFGV